jgi:Outer membrane protein beta-barrel domain
MLRKLMVLVPVVALLALPSLALAQFEAGNYALELFGTGASNQDFDSHQVAAGGELGYFLTKEAEVGIRQGVSWSDSENTPQIWTGDTRVFGNYHFDLDRWQPYVGAFIGYIYGDQVSDFWSAGPEGGVKYFVNSTTYVDLNIAYGFNLDEGIDDGSFFYGLGLGFRW